MNDTIDPATVEVIRNYLTSATDEMARTLIRTAPATIIYEILDFGISLYDRELNLVADSPGVTMFLGANDFALEKALEEIDRDSLVPGDILLMNYPYWSATHSQDIVLIAPIFFREEPVGYSVCRAHWVDVGAKDPAYVLDSTDVHQEGIMFPPMKIHKGGEVNEELMDIIRFNSRLPNVVIGELNSQISALETGKKRFQELHDKYGTETVEESLDRIIDHGERHARDAVRDLPDGTWSATDYADGPTQRFGDEPIRRSVSVTIDGDEFSVDFSESSDQVDMPFNISYGMTETAAKLCFKTVTTPNEESNTGHYKPLDVVVEEGNLFNATYPAPMFIIWPAMGAVDVLFKALAQGMPERIPASSGGDIPNIRLYGEDETTGRNFVQACNDGQGWGATHTADGESGLNHITESLIKNNPVEVMENKVPVVHIDKLTLRQDSGGCGEYRGGLGVRRDYRFTGTGNALSVNHKTREPGWAIGEGSPGAKGAVVLSLEDEWEDRLEIVVDNTDDYPEADKNEKWVGMMRGEFHDGEVVSNRTGGGGGYGHPFDRDPELVREDVIDGYVSREAAEEEYGVVIREDNSIDREKTAELRQA